MAHVHAHDYSERPHPEFVALDLGGEVGALILHTDPALHGAEIEISPTGADDSRTHKQVLERRAGGEPAFTAVKLTGAAYLVFLGAQTLWRAFRHRSLDTVHRSSPEVEPKVVLRQGLLSNLGNPKMAVFFTSLLPQFGGASFPALLALGLVFSTISANELQAVQLIPLIIVPQVLMSGVIWPVATLPVILKQLAYVLPLTYAVDALRGVMIRGAGFGGLALDLAVLCGAAFLLLAVGTRALGRQAAQWAR